jgi:hypothetical protein
MFMIEPRATGIKATITIKKDKNRPKRLAAFKKDLQVLLRKHGVKPKRKPR